MVTIEEQCILVNHFINPFHSDPRIFLNVDHIFRSGITNNFITEFRRYPGKGLFPLWKHVNSIPGIAPKACVISVVNGFRSLRVRKKILCYGIGTPINVTCTWNRKNILVNNGSKRRQWLWVIGMRILDVFHSCDQ